jgi:oligoendopeptidase F
MFAKFEKNAFEKYEKDGIISAEILNDIYQNVSEDYSGNVAEPNPNTRYSWSRIPHFYSPFYVYQYATGIAAAWTFADGILKGDKEKIDKYLTFLKSGGKDYPLNILKEAGVDMENPKVLENAFSKFEEYITRLEKLV